jgi:phosphoenolpyruvate carboxylase
MSKETTSGSALHQFNDLVGTRFQLYNSLFTSLPFHKIEKTGVLLTLFLIHCEEGYQKKQSPEEIIDSFLQQYTTYTITKDKLDLLFRFIQYAERQIVLFDAVEDAAFTQIHDISKAGVLQLAINQSRNSAEDRQRAIQALEDLEVRLVLTAHPTQFYPGEVLGIIHDLSEALAKDDTSLVNAYLRQLGKTPFMKKQKPSPYDEAVNLMWFLENVFYPAAGNILNEIQDAVPDMFSTGRHPVIRLGFWPGGDRDGNRFVKAETTLKVAQALKERLLRRYYADARTLRRRLTFSGIAPMIQQLERAIFHTLFTPGFEHPVTKESLLQDLQQIRQVLIEEHGGLFVQLVDDLIAKIMVFGMFFATLDIRQDSSVHAAMIAAVTQDQGDYESLEEKDKIKALSGLIVNNQELRFEDEVQQDIVDVIKDIKTIQEQNGEEGCNRYIISHCTSVANVLEVYTLFRLSGWKQEDMSVDIVPLFETIEDLQHAAGVMDALYRDEIYGGHLMRRHKKQTIMLGFSDGTKDGGYLMANWSIYKAKEALTRISRQYGIDVVFFDGRGGPPARGGGKTQKFYSSMGSNIADKEIQLTIQGQTISSNFGNIDSAQYNLEQLIQAGIYNRLYAAVKPTLNESEDQLLTELSEESFRSYTDLKNDENFLEYLSEISPLRFYADTNIGSRPAKRNSGKLNMNDLRAIPFVGAWSQLKQNVSGYYGVGTALKKLGEQGKWEELKLLYKNSSFFKALLDNCEMATKKCYFPLTAYLSNHPKFGALWRKIYEEYLLTQEQLLLLSGKEELMGDEPVSNQSIQMRERIVLPLATIQQYGLMKLRQEQTLKEAGTQQVYEKMVMRCSFGIINAGRNSA